jgi:predicted Zn-dependent peptidase
MKRRLLWAVPLAAALLPAAAAAQGAAVRVDYVDETLPNGLRVIYSVDRTTPVAAVDIWYDVGSKHEQAGRTGFAHLFEHMMFKGSRNVGDREHNGLLEAAGGRSGSDINGTTWFDRTNYFEQVPSNMLELALWLEADRMGTLLETLTLEKLDNQREVVKNERRLRVDNQPYGSQDEKTLAYAFPEGHPYRHSVIGSMEDLSAATVEDVQAFFRTYYAPNNAVLVIAGDIDVDQAKAMVRKHFGDIPRGPEPPALGDMTLPAKIGASHREVVNDANASAPAVYVTYRVPPRRDPRNLTADLMAATLAGGRSAPLYASLVRDRQIAANVFAYTYGNMDGADLLVFGAIGKPGTSADSLEQALLGELSRAPQLLTQAGLDRVRAGRRYDFVATLQRTGGFGGRADLLAEYTTYFGDPGRVNRILPDLDAVTLADVQGMARSQIAPDNRVILVYVPAKAPTAQVTR